MRAAFWRQFATSLRLQLRHSPTLIYGVAVPLVFFAAFRTLYRYESPPLGRHLDELLAVTALSGACFALPAWLVSERARGVWRRYRLAPVPGAVLLTAMVCASYVLIVAAGILQLVVANLAGTPFPARPLDLWLAFTAACIAFLGLGLLITMLADTVPAAQALGQTVFLPMLILGGIAVPVETLPAWVQRVAAMLPGRYAADAIAAAVAGQGAGSIAPHAAALAVMGLAAGIAAVVVFRWDTTQRTGATRTLSTLAVLIASWVAIGLAWHVGRSEDRPLQTTTGAVSLQPATTIPIPPTQTPTDPAPARTTAGSPPAPRPAPPPAPSAPPPKERTWRDVTLGDIEMNLVFVGLPPDHGVVTPISAEYRRREDVECIRTALGKWAPAAVDDPVQRARNVLLLAAVPDVLQNDLERDVPFAVFDYLQQKIPKDDLIKVLYWIATHRDDGSLDALDQIDRACVDLQPPDDEELLRERVAIYAMKLLGRILGRIK